MKNPPVSRIVVRPVSPKSTPFTEIPSRGASQKPLGLMLVRVTRVLELNLLLSSPLKKKIVLQMLGWKTKNKPKGNLSVIHLVGSTGKMKRNNRLRDQPGLCKSLHRCRNLLARKGLPGLTESVCAWSRIELDTNRLRKAHQAINILKGAHLLISDSKRMVGQCKTSDDNGICHHISRHLSWSIPILERHSCILERTTGLRPKTNTLYLWDNLS